MRDYNFDSHALKVDPQPMLAVSTILRDLAMRLVEDLFSRDNKRPPNLTTLLSQQEARAIAEVHLWKRKGGTSAAPARIPRTGQDRLKPTLKDVVTKALKGETKPDEWQTTFHDRMVSALGGGTPGNGLPLEMEPLIEKAAWTDPRFRRFMIAKTREFLKERVLFIPGEQWVPEFSGDIFWVLVGLADVKEVEGQRTLTRLAREIREGARHRVMKEGWANFWDQWLVRLARQRWAFSFDRDKSMFCRSLLALPLLSRPTAPAPEQGPYVAKLTLWERIKKWFPTFLGGAGKRKDPLLKLKKTLEPMAIAHPDWEDRRPDFLKEVLNV